MHMHSSPEERDGDDGGQLYAGSKGEPDGVIPHAKLRKGRNLRGHERSKRVPVRSTSNTCCVTIVVPT